MDASSGSGRTWPRPRPRPQVSSIQGTPIGRLVYVRHGPRLRRPRCQVHPVKTDNSTGSGVSASRTTIYRVCSQDGAGCVCEHGWHMPACLQPSTSTAALRRAARDWPARPHRRGADGRLAPGAVPVICAQVCPGSSFPSQNGWTACMSVPGHDPEGSSCPLVMSPSSHRPPVPTLPAGEQGAEAVNGTRVATCICHAKHGACACPQ